MRRTLSILLLALCTLPLLTPLLALVGTGTGTASPGESTLPACCRRLGAHGCAMSPARQSAERSARQPRLTARERTLTRPSQPCPFRTEVLALTTPTPLTPALAPQTGLHRLATNHPRGPAQAAVQHRVARERARHKRGPPSLVA